MFIKGVVITLKYITMLQIVFKTLKKCFKNCTCSIQLKKSKKALVVAIFIKTRVFIPNILKKIVGRTKFNAPDEIQFFLFFFCFLLIFFSGVF